MNKLVYIALGAYLVLSAAGLLLIKQGSNDFVFGFNGGLLNLSINTRMILGMIFYILSFLLFILIIPKFNLSFIYPLATGSLYLIILVVSFLFLGEKITTVQAFGSLLILFGIIALNIR